MPSTDPQAGPQYIGFECHLCGTRMYGLPHQVGQQFKCPDCGARTAVPPPPKPKAKNIPAAMEGAQYELWDADTRPAELIARQPRYIAVKCRRCDTLMHAAEQQVGAVITCPDCGAKHVVPSLAAARLKPSPLTSDGDTPLLDPAAAPGDRPPVNIAPRHPMVYEEEREAEIARLVAKARRTGKKIPFDARGRPILPRWPLVSGILPFLFSAGVPERWAAVSGGCMFGGYLISEALIWGGLGGLAAMSALMFFVIGMIICLLITAAAAGMFRAIVTDSSEGNQQVQNWGTRDFTEWFPDLLYLVMAGFISAFPGGMIARLATDDIAARFAIAGAGAFVCFPVVYLSQLYINSPWAPLAGRVLASMGRCPGSWLLLYLESALLWGGCVAAGVAAASLRIHPVLPIPLYVAAFFLYGRLLGRLGWRVAEAMPLDEA